MYMRRSINIILNTAICIFAAIISVSCLTEKEGPSAGRQNVMIELSVKAADMTKATEALSGKARKLTDTITIKAVDLHLLNGDTDKISLGDNVHLLSEPHGLDREYTCEAMEIDIFNPEKTGYTFGKKIDTLVDSAASMVNQLKRHSGDIFCHLRHIKELDHAVTINIQHMDEAMNKLSAVAVEIDAAKAEIALKASQYSVDELGYRTTNAELRLDGAEAEIDHLGQLFCVGIGIQDHQLLGFFGHGDIQSPTACDSLFVRLAGTAAACCDSG